jgi:hypothetical protein
MRELGGVHFPAMIVGSLAMVGVLDKFCAKVMEDMLFPWLARAADDWL